jgi:tetratricopeptide (TPR) repeat protein
MLSSRAGGAARWVFLFLGAALAAVLILEAARLGAAGFYAQSSDPADWERAAALEPGNAARWQRLGRYRQWDFQNADLARAISYYERAAQLQPQSPFHWLDLASAHEMAGDPSRARAAFEKAKASQPISGEVAWNYGNFLLRTGNIAQALLEIRRAVSVDPTLAPSAVSVCWRGGIDVDRIFAEVVPPRAQTLLDAVDFFLAQQQLDAALKTWARLATLSEKIDLRRSFPFLDELIRRGQAQEAGRVWRQALAAAGRESLPGVRGSTLWDGGFEEDLANGGLGWRWLEIPGASFGFDSAHPHSGSRSLRIDFDGTVNLDFQHLLQYVVVEPNTRYRFRTWLRLEGISTDSGLFFRVYDHPGGASLNLSTPDLIGTVPWMETELEFTTGPQARLLVIALRRATSHKLDNKLRGSIWIDDVSLEPVAIPQPVRP